MRIFQLAILLVMLICVQQSGVAIQDDQFIKMREHFLQMQKKLAEQELNDLQTKFNLDEGICDQILPRLSIDIEVAADLISEVHRGASNYDRDEHLCSQLRESIWLEVERKLPQETLDDFEAFKTEELQTQAVADEVAIGRLLVYLDNRLFFSERQLRELRELYKKDWYSGFSQR